MQLFNIKGRNEKQMARDKARDDEFFNCSQEHEFQYVSGLYSEKEKVYKYLKEKCADGTIKYSTHMQVYEMIANDLGYPIP